MMLAQQVDRKQRSPSKEVLGLQARVERTRREYLRHLHALPEPLGAICAQFYEQRVGRVSPRPLLGEYLPWLLADLFGMKPSHTTRMAKAWLPLYLHVLAVDDLLDEAADVDRSVLPIVASVFSERAFSEYLAIFGPDPRFWSRFEDFFLSTGAAGAREMQLGRGRVTSITSAELRRTGEKIDLVKICYSSLALVNGREPSELHLAALSDFETGVQLLDDISDWDEDLAIGSFTPLLALAFDGVDEADRRRQTPSDVLARLVASGALGQCLDEAAERLERALAILASHPRSPGVRLMTAMIANAHWLRGRERAVSRLVDEESWRLGETDLGRIVVRSPRLQTALDELGRSIKVVAQSS